MPPHPIPATMAASAPNWFAGAPCSKAVLLVTILTYLVSNSQNTGPLLAMDSSKIRRAFEFHRYWTSKLNFRTPGEFVIGSVLLTFLSRKFEREMGSRKYILFVAFVNVFSVCAEVVMIQGGVYPWELQYAGPYAMLGALFWLYHRYTPRLYPKFVGVLGLDLSEKIFYYGWFVQVVTAGGASTVAVACVGACATLLYLSVPVMSSLEIPDSLARLLSSLTDRFCDPLPRLLVPMGGGANNNGRTGNTASLRAARPTHPVFGQAPPLGPSVRHVAATQRNPPIVADPQAIEQLCNMGFPRPQVVEALQFTDNHVERAADRLLTQQGILS